MGMIRFTLTADPACGVAQAVLLALRSGGHVPVLDRRGGAVTELLQRRGRICQRSRGAEQVLDRISAHIGPPCPQQRAWAAQLLPLLDLLELVGTSSDPQDLDLHIFRLRAHLARLEQRLVARPESTPAGVADCLLAVIWWRIALLDRHFATYIALGFPAVQRHGQTLLARLNADGALEAAAAPLLQRFTTARAVPDPADLLALWQNGLGPEAGTARPRHH